MKLDEVIITYDPLQAKIVKASPAKKAGILLEREDCTYEAVIATVAYISRGSNVGGRMNFNTPAGEWYRISAIKIPKDKYEEFGIEAAPADEPQ